MARGRRRRAAAATTVEDASGHRSKMSAGALVAMTYFAVAGSPYGAEWVLIGVGPLYGLLGFILMPLVWSMPLTHMCATLSCRFPEDGGFAVWASTAFGRRAGILIGFLRFVCVVLDSAVYPKWLLVVMLGEQEIGWLPVSYKTTLRLGSALVTVVLTMGNLCGMGKLSRLAGAAMVVVMLPFAVFSVLACRYPKVYPAGMLYARPLAECDWSMALQVLFWSVSYFDTVSSLAGEVVDPRRNFKPALYGSMLLIVVQYVVPLAALSSVLDDDEMYDELDDGASVSAWPKLYESACVYVCKGLDHASLCESTLQLSIVGSVCMSCVMLFMVEFSTTSMMLCGMANRGLLPKALGQKTKAGAPWAALVLICAATSVVNLCMSVDRLIGMLNVVYIFSIGMQFAAFVKFERQSRTQSWRSACGLAALLAGPAVVGAAVLWCSEAWAIGGAAVCVVAGMVFGATLQFSKCTYMQLQGDGEVLL